MERTCHQCEMLESEAADFCMDDDGRMAQHNWNDPRDAEIERLHTALEAHHVGLFPGNKCANCFQGDVGGVSG